MLQPRRHDTRCHHALASMSWYRMASCSSIAVMIQDGGKNDNGMRWMIKTNNIMRRQSNDYTVTSSRKI